MEVTMRFMKSLSLALLASAAVPAAAQEYPAEPAEATQPPAPPTSAEPPPAAGLTPEQRATYESWPEAARVYFDRLPPERQTFFLSLSDADKAKLLALPAAEQESAWTALEKQQAKTPGR
jgi:hypothetical protein